MREIFVSVVLVINLVGCQKSERWLDVAVRASGQTVTVERRVTLKLSGGELSHAFNLIPTVYEIQANFPNTNSSLKWTGEKYVQPIFVDSKEGKFYLVALIPNCGAIVKKLSLPRFPYLFFVGTQDGKWSVVPPDQFPIEFKAANLSATYEESWMKYEGMKPGGTRSPKEIEEQNKHKPYMTAGHFQINFPRTFDEWNYKHKHTNDAQSQYCRPREG